MSESTKESLKATIWIEYCVGCRFIVRASWIAEELLFTFAERLEAVALKPSKDGVFRVSIDDKLLFDRKSEGRFPDPRELRAMIRDHIAPEMGLGHSEPAGD